MVGTVGTTAALLAVLCSPHPGDAPAAESKAEKTVNGPCFLEEAPDGQVWVRKPLVYLGMVGTMAPPAIRLRKELAGLLAPLRTRVHRDPKAPRTLYLFGMPRLGTGERRLALLSLETQSILLLPADERKTEFDQRTYEIVSTRILEAEFLAREWLEAWKILDGSLQNTVAVSLTTPGDLKRRSLEAEIERGCWALRTMLGAKEAEEDREALSKIEPAAKIVHTFGLRVAGEWGGQLRWCAGTLRIEPRTPIPEVEWEKKPTQRRNEKEKEKGKPETWPLKDWGVELRAAGEDLLAKNLILRGTVVEKVLPGGSKIGLEPGDIIFDYKSVYDLVMGGTDFGGPSRILENYARSGAWVNVIRGAKLVTLHP